MTNHKFLVANYCVKVNHFKCPNLDASSHFSKTNFELIVFGTHKYGGVQSVWSIVAWDYGPDILFVSWCHELGEKNVLATPSHLLILRVDAFMIYLGEANILAKNPLNPFGQITSDLQFQPFNTHYLQTNLGYPHVFLAFFRMHVIFLVDCRVGKKHSLNKHGVANTSNKSGPKRPEHLSVTWMAVM